MVGHKRLRGSWVFKLSYCALALAKRWGEIKRGGEVLNENRGMIWGSPFCSKALPIFYIASASTPQMIDEPYYWHIEGLWGTWNRQRWTTSTAISQPGLTLTNVFPLLFSYPSLFLWFNATSQFPLSWPSYNTMWRAVVVQSIFPRYCPTLP